MHAVRDGGATLLPIDSEHSAIFQCLPEDRAHLAASASTTSCSPPRAARSATATRRRCASVTPDEACAHPNWVMGRKISVDSATMMNKALEVIEARWLFDLRARADRGRDPSAEHHPLDGRLPRQLGAGAARHARHARADRLRPGVPGAHRVGRDAARLRARSRALTFEAADLRASTPACSWPGTRCAARRAARAVLNAANEEAVAAFLAGTIRFDQIHSGQRRHARGA